MAWITLPCTRRGWWLIFPLLWDHGLFLSRVRLLWEDKYFYWGTSTVGARAVLRPLEVYCVYRKVAWNKLRGSFPETPLALCMRCAFTWPVEYHSTTVLKSYALLLCFCRLITVIQVVAKWMFDWLNTKPKKMYTDSFCYDLEFCNLGLTWHNCLSKPSTFDNNAMLPNNNAVHVPGLKILR